VNKGTIQLLKQRTIRHRLGCVGRGGDLSEHRSILHPGEETVQKTAGGESARAEKTGGHDVRHRDRSSILLASR